MINNSNTRVPGIRCLMADLALFFIYTLAPYSPVTAQSVVLDSNLYYIQTGNSPEWDEFAAWKPIKEFSIYFDGVANASEYTLELRQYEVKEAWRVLLNDTTLGMLTQDINDMVIYLPVPPNRIHDGKNSLRLIPPANLHDDIVAGNMIMHRKKISEITNESNHGREGTVHRHFQHKVWDEAKP